MEILLVIIGLFIFAVVIKNKDLTKNKENQELLAFMAMAVIWLTLGGLDFIIPGSTTINPSYAYLFLFFNGLAGVTVASMGLPKIISRIAWVSFLAFIILGSFY